MGFIYNFTRRKAKDLAAWLFSVRMLSNGGDQHDEEIAKEKKAEVPLSMPIPSSALTMFSFC